MKKFVKCVWKGTGRSDDVDNIRRVATTYKVNSNLCMAMHVDPWLNKGTCPSYFLKWMDALCSPLLFRHLGLTDVFHFMQSL